jgi:hypothetical protein
MHQERLFDVAPAFSDRRLESTERVRLNKQCIEILRLMCAYRSRVSNAELNRVAFRYSARLYDLKQAAIRISIVERNHETGVNWYAFESEADREKAQQYL